MAKLLSETYLFSMYEGYESKLIAALIKSERLNKNIEGFDDILYEVKKRNVPAVITKVLTSPNVVFIVPELPLPNNLDVFVAKDPKDNRKIKVFIDTTGLVYMDEQTGRIKIANIDALICALLQAMSAMIYYIDDNRYINSNKISEEGAQCFAKMFTFIIDYLFKIGNIRSLRNKCMYLATCYYLINILGKDEDSNSVFAIARKIAGFDERESDIIKIQINSDTFKNIKFFISSISEILKLDKLTTEAFIEKWMYLYGTRTVFALELFPNFAGMMTDVYIGSYINNQKTIEKVTGQSMVQFTKALIEIGVASL